MAYHVSSRSLKLSIVVVLVIACVAGLAFVLQRNSTPDTARPAGSRPGTSSVDIVDFKSCVAAGNPVQESYPEVCVTSSGQRFVNPDQSM